MVDNLFTGVLADPRKRTRQVMETRMKNQQMLEDQSVFKKNMKEAEGVSLETCESQDLKSF